MPYLHPNPGITSSAPSQSSSLSNSQAQSVLHTSPSSSSSGKPLTSHTLPSRYIKPIHIPTTSKSQHLSYDMTNLHSLFSKLTHRDSTEILRHGKHAQQSSTPPQNQNQSTGHSSSPSSGHRSSKAAATTQAQPQQAQAYYQNDMPAQGLAANNGLSSYSCGSWR